MLPNVETRLLCQCQVCSNIQFVCNYHVCLKKTTGVLPRFEFGVRPIDRACPPHRPHRSEKVAPSSPAAGALSNFAASEISRENVGQAEEEAAGVGGLRGF